MRNRLKMRSKMRNKGVILEVSDRKDVELVRQADLRKVGLKTGEPNKFNPSLIIYDVEQDHKV